MREERMLKMIKLFFVTFLMLISTTSHAFIYDNDLLNTYAKLSPRFILLSTQVDKIEDEINICLLHDKLDEKSALHFIELINDNYPKGIKKYSIKTTKTYYEDIDSCKSSNLLFLLKSKSDVIDTTMVFAKQNKIMTISYDSTLLENGVDISLFLGRNVVPYLNMKSMREKEIELDNRLLRISKIYFTKKESSR